MLGRAAPLALVAVAWATGASRGARAAGPMPQEAYVWQREWTDGVREGIARGAGRLAGFVALHTEVSFSGRAPRRVVVPLDGDALRACGRPVGLALRVGPYAGPFDASAPATREVVAAATDLLADARARGIEPVEVQMDFDCAASRLDGYREWVGEVRGALGGVPLVLTVLPSWMGRRAFRDLVAAADGYVLQVHSLARPRGRDASATLCDPNEARSWVEQAGRIGLPFRVALPTYGYRCAFDAGGRLLGISAEGPEPDRGEGVAHRDLRADPAEMAALVRGWTADRPAALRGVLWYRLPVREDVLNWRWETLAAVADGRTPCPAPRAHLRRGGPALFDVDVENGGDADVVDPVAVRVSWRNGPLLASDALGGFTAGEASGASFRLQGAVAGRLGPGERRSVGWVRFAEPVAEGDVDVAVETP